MGAGIAAAGVAYGKTVKQFAFVDLKPALAADRAALLEAFARILDSGQFILGAELQRFEAEFAAYCGARHAVGVGNGLDALYLTLQAIGVGPGDEVIVPAHTFVATWLAVTRCGAKPVPVEPDAQTCLATAESIGACLTPRTKAVIAVHLYGCIQDIDRIAWLCSEKGIVLVEDAAQAHGARLDGRHAGTYGAAGCFSFYPTKNLGACGDAGAVVTDDDCLRDRLHALRSYGARQRYVHEVRGVNSRLDELQAAWLRIRLRRLDVETARRNELAAIYLRRLSSLPQLRLPAEGPAGAHAWHLFVVQTHVRDALQRHLRENGVETLIHYPRPVYRLPPFADFAPGHATASDSLACQVLSLPLGLHLRDDDVHAICDQVADFFELHRDAS